MRAIDFGMRAIKKKFEGFFRSYIFLIKLGNIGEPCFWSRELIFWSWAPIFWGRAHFCAYNSGNYRLLSKIIEKLNRAQIRRPEINCRNLAVVPGRRIWRAINFYEIFWEQAVFAGII